jgi:Cu-Zn family superoxide dismutase
MPDRSARPVVRPAVLASAALGLAGLALAAPALAGPGAHVADDLTRYGATSPLALAPEGASAKVHSVETGSGRTIVTLHVRGMQPLARYGAHAHVSPCGATGAAAGPHFQFEQGGLTDPAYANPANEIWLDLTTDAAGNGSAKAVVERPFPPHRRPASVIIHERHTSTGAGVAGTAGQRVACLTVPF